MNKEKLQELRNLYEQIRIINLQINSKIKVTDFSDDTYDLDGNSLGRFVIDLESRKGNYVFGYNSTLPYFLEFGEDLYIDCDYDGLFYIDKRGEYNFVCSLYNGRDLGGSNTLKNSIVFLADGRVLIRSFSISSARDYREYIGNDTKKKQYNTSTTHFLEKYYIYDEKKLSVEEIPYKQGKEMWQNSAEYSSRVEQEKLNHERNLMRKTEPSALSKKEKQAILKRYK